MTNFALAAAEVRRLREFRGAVEAAPTDAWTPWRSAVADGRFGDAADFAEERGFQDRCATRSRLNATDEGVAAGAWEGGGQSSAVCKQAPF
jgi:hypothetical protein